MDSQVPCLMPTRREHVYFQNFRFDRPVAPIPNCKSSTPLLRCWTHLKVVGSKARLIIAGLYIEAALRPLVAKMLLFQDAAQATGAASCLYLRASETSDWFSVRCISASAAFNF